MVREGDVMSKKASSIGFALVALFAGLILVPQLRDIAWVFATLSIVVSAVAIALGAQGKNGNTDAKSSSHSHSSSKWH